MNGSDIVITLEINGHRMTGIINNHTASELRRLHLDPVKEMLDGYYDAMLLDHKVYDDPA